jgi:hypothetical protein
MTTYLALTPADELSVAIMQVVDGADIETCIKKYADIHGQPKFVREISLADLPNNRLFRNAWRDDGKAIIHDMPTVNAIYLERIRQARIPILADLDMQYLQADEKSDVAAKTAIATQKQVLRDLPTTLDLSSAKTPDDVIKLWPAILPVNPYEVSQ